MSRMFDPLDPHFQVSPYEGYKRLREEPAIFVASLNAWFVGRYKDVHAMSLEPQTFSNARFSEISKGEFDYAPSAAQLIATDPPEHTRLRTLASQPFRPSRVRAMKDTIGRITAQYLDPVVAAGQPFDFHADLASRIPIHAITEMLGVPAEEGQTFRRWTADILSATNRSTMSPDELAQIRRSVDNARAYFTGVIQQRRGNLGADMISAWIEAQEERDVLTDEEILGLAILLLVGGDTTTAHLLSNTMIALWDHPDVLDEVRRDPSLIPRVIEESLRYESPVQSVFWNTTRDVDVDDVHIPKDAAVIGVWSSANRDPERFPDPDRFDLHRKSSGHVAFGFGPHFCLGANLARAEARIVLEALFERLPNLKRADHGPVSWTPSYWIRGPQALPVVA
jgi:cytochrome P450 family 109